MLVFKAYLCIDVFLVAVIIPSIEIGHKIPNESFCILNVLKKMCQLIIWNLMAPEEKKHLIITNTF